MHQFSTWRAFTRQKSADPTSKSLCPNYVVVDNKEEVGKKYPPQLKRMSLDNTSVESDSLLPELEMDEELNGAIKEVDVNVQQFIKEIASKSICIDDQDANKELESICKNSHEELKHLTNFVSTMDDNAKNEVMETLVGLFKNGLMSRMNPQETEQKVSIFKDVCKGLISDYKSPNGSSSIRCTESGSAIETKIDLNTKPKAVFRNTKCSKKNGLPNRVHFDESWKERKVGNKELCCLDTQLRNINQEKGPIKQRCVEKYQREIEKRAKLNSARSLRDFPKDNLNKPKAENLFRTGVFDKKPKKKFAKKTFKDDALENLLGSDIKRATTKTEYIFKPYHKASPSEDSLKLSPHPQQRLKNPKLGVMETFPEGIQTEFLSKNQDYQTPTAEPFRFQISKNRSDIAINPPYDCPWKLQKSKSIYHISDENSVKKSREKRNTSVPIDVTKNCSFGEVERNKSINSLNKGMKSAGDSSGHFGQILFDVSHHSLDKNISSWEMPALSHSFNTDYLSLDHLSVRASGSSITEEEYRIWLRKKSNWARHSFTGGNLKNQDYETVWDTFVEQKPNFILPPRSSFSDWAFNYILRFGELFLYEHVVISRALKFFLTYNMKKTRAPTKWNRCVQISCFFVLFCTTWYFFNYYLYEEPSVKKAARFWG